MPRMVMGCESGRLEKEGKIQKRAWAGKAFRAKSFSQALGHRATPIRIANDFGMAGALWHS